MGSICSTPRKVLSPQSRICAPKLSLRTDSQREAFVTQLPKTYKELLQLTSTRYKVPEPFIVLKATIKGREVSISDEDSFSAAVQQITSGNFTVTVFFPSRSAIALKNNDNPTTTAYDRSGFINDKETFNILHPVPIDVEAHSRSSMSHSRHSSLFLFRSEKEPRTSQCLTGFLMIFDAYTQDSFKYFSEVVDDGSRSVQLPSGSLVVTGGQRNLGLHIKLDPAIGTFRRLPSMTQGRCHHASVSMQGSVWVIGGITDTVLGHCEVFENDKWVEMPSLKVPRAWASASVLGTAIYVFGGKEESSIEKFENGDWMELSVQMHLPLAMPGVFHFDEEFVLLIGGRSKTGDVYDCVKLSLERGLFVELAALPVTDHFTSESIAYKDEIFFQGSVATYKFDPADNSWHCVE